MAPFSTRREGTDVDDSNFQFYSITNLLGKKTKRGNVISKLENWGIPCHLWKIYYPVLATLRDVFR